MTYPVRIATPQEEVLGHLQAMISAGEDPTSAATSALQSARESGERVNWFVGDVALLVKKSPYGTKAVRQIAKDSNFAVQTVYEYAAVSFFYIPEARAKYAAEPALCYSHLKTAMRLKEPRLADEFLMEVAKNAYTVEECRIQLLKKTGKPVPPRKVYDGPLCIERLSADGRMTVTIDDISNLQSGKRYTVAIYEMSED